MGELINGRTPEEIKSRLKCVIFDCRGIDCKDCEFNDLCKTLDMPNDAANALALIERLESERDAAPVVRCRECKFRGDTFYCPMTINVNCGMGFRAVFAGADNDFCSKGTRMDEKEND